MQDRIRRIFSGGRVPHSFLITGEDRAAKESFALSLARALVCESTTPPCGVCRSCTMSEHPDVIFALDPARLKDGKVRIEDVRAMVADVYVLPNDAQRKVYLVFDAARLSAYDQNVLLATLETPPQHACFILTATHASELLPTVVSRCTQIKLSGSDAVLQEAEAALSILTPLAQKDELGVFSACVALESYKREELREVLEACRTLLRDGALSHLSPIAGGVSVPRFTYAEFLAATSALDRASDGIRRNLGVSIILAGLSARLIQAVTTEEELN